MRKSRRGFLGLVAKALGTAVFLPSLALAKTKKVGLSLKKVPKLQKVGGSTILKIKGKWILFVRTAPSDVKAVSAICTHQKCEVHYNASDKRVACACHGSKFTLDGKVLTGPAETNLHNYNATLNGDKIVFNLE